MSYFWKNQPMMSNSVTKEGIIKELTSADFTKYQLPDNYSWITIDPNNNEDIDNIYTFLKDNYVEDCNSIFRLTYSKEFLKWYLMCPNYTYNLYLAIIDKDNKLVGFISGIPTIIFLRQKIIDTYIVNFLCVKKSMRDMNMAPILISKLAKEITKHNGHGFTHAIYTLSKTITKPFGKCQYWHREINTKKLIDIGFSHIPEQLNSIPNAVEILEDFYKVAEYPKHNMRKLQDKDIEQVTIILNKYLNKFDLHTIFTEEDVIHWFIPKERIIYSYVLENNGIITDFISFVEIDSSIIKKNDMLRTAMLFYFAANNLTIKELINEAIIYAKINGFDVFNALDIMGTKDILEELKFDLGTGTLVYNFYNYKVKDINVNNIGTMLL